MDITQILTTGAPARFYCNGVRIGRAAYEALMDRAYSDGTLCCLSTKAKQMPGGTFKRWNYSVISEHPQR